MKGGKEAFGSLPSKSRKGHIRKKHYFPCHFDGLDQLLFGTGNYLFIKWCAGIVNAKLNFVRVYLMLNFIPIIKIPGRPKEYRIRTLCLLAPSLTSHVLPSRLALKSNPSPPRPALGARLPTVRAPQRCNGVAPQQCLIKSTTLSLASLICNKFSTHTISFCNSIQTCIPSARLFSWSL